MRNGTSFSAFPFPDFMTVKNGSMQPLLDTKNIHRAVEIKMFKANAKVPFYRSVAFKFRL